MNCFCCGIHEVPAVGLLYCAECAQRLRHQQDEDEAAAVARHERWRTGTYTWLYFCGRCGSEVYREARVPRRRNARREEARGKAARLALVQHVLAVRHRGSTRLHGPAQISDLSGDDEYEVAATGLPEDRCPRHMQASTVMRALSDTGLV